MTRPLFLYDLGSPYAWLTAERIDSLLEADWIPVLLGGIFHSTGRGSWARTDARAAGIAEIERRATERGLGPLSWPPGWPGDGLRAMRAAVWAHSRDSGPDFALAAFRIHFTEGRPLSEEPALAEAARTAGLDPGELLAATGDPGIKAKLRENTDLALSLGVFGVPSVVAGGQVFWGDDQLEAAAAASAAA